MSERKSAEVKFRCTPTFKAELAAAADAAGETLSEYIGRSVWARQNQTIDGTGLVDNAVDLLGVNGPLGTRHGRGKFVEDDIHVVECDKSCRPWEFCACKAGEDTA